MKTLITTIAIFATYTSVFAISSPINIIDAGKTIVVNLENMTRSGAQLELRDVVGNIVYASSVAPSTRTRTFDLSNLPAGNYTLQIENAIEIITQDILVGENNVILDEQVRETFKPSVRFQNDIIKVNFLALGQATSISVSDDSGQVLYTEAFNNTSTVKRQISLAKQLRGTYKVSVESGDESFITWVRK